MELALVVFPNLADVFKSNIIGSDGIDTGELRRQEVSFRFYIRNTFLGIDSKPDYTLGTGSWPTTVINSKNLRRFRGIRGFLLHDFQNFLTRLSAILRIPVNRNRFFDRADILLSMYVYPVA